MPTCVHNPIGDKAIIDIGNLHWLRLDGSNELTGNVLYFQSQEADITWVGGGTNKLEVNIDGFNYFYIDTNLVWTRNDLSCNALTASDAVYFRNNTFPALRVIRTSDGGTGVFGGMFLEREKTSGGGVSDGYGISIQFRLENASSVPIRNAGLFGCRWHSATNGSETGQFIFNPAKNGSVGGSDVPAFTITATTPGGNKTVDVDGDSNITGDKFKFTEIGGMAIKLTNKTGSNTVEGQLVKPDTANNDSFITIAPNDQEIVGAVLDGGVSDGSETWIVISGIAKVLIDFGGCASGDRMVSSILAGTADVWNVGGAVATHFQEIGHCIETRIGPGLARVVLHFN